MALDFLPLAGSSAVILEIPGPTAVTVANCSGGSDSSGTEGDGEEEPVDAGSAEGVGGGVGVTNGSALTLRTVVFSLFHFKIVPAASGGRISFTYTFKVSPGSSVRSSVRFARSISMLFTGVGVGLGLELGLGLAVELADGEGAGVGVVPPSPSAAVAGRREKGMSKSRTTRRNGMNLRFIAASCYLFRKQ